MSINNHLDNLSDLILNVEDQTDIVAMQHEVDRYCEENDLDSAGFEIFQEYNEKLDETFTYIYEAE